MAGLTAEGFVAKTYEEILSGFQTKQRATIDLNLDTSEFSLVGQLNGIMAVEIAGVWELAEEVNDSFDPDKARGAAQDALYSLTYTLRDAAKYSTVEATVALQPGTNIAKGAATASVSGNPSAKFVNDEPMVNAGGAPAAVPVRFVATKTGPVLANAGTLTVIDSLLTGWTSITNVADATPGADIELDSLFRLRRTQEIAAQGGGTVPGIKADLLKLGTVRAANVLENDTDFIVGALPPKSLEAIVYSEDGAGDEVTIANMLWKNKTGGTRLVGLLSVVITDSEGYSRTVFFSRPTELEVMVLLRLKIDPDKYVGDVAAKAAIVTALEDPTSAAYIDVGSDVFSGPIIAAAQKLAGVRNADARVTLNTEPVWATAPTEVAVQQREIATFDTSRVLITIVP